MTFVSKQANNVCELIKLDTYSGHLDYALIQTHYRNAKAEEWRNADLGSGKLKECMYCHGSCQVQRESQTCESEDRSEFDLFEHLGCPASEQLFLYRRVKTGFFRREEDTGTAH